MIIRRAAVLLVFGSALGIFFASFLGPRPAQGEDAPPELREPAEPPTARSRDLSRPFVEATRKVRPAVVKITNYVKNWRGGWAVQSSGSGFLFTDGGHILTNRHVIANTQKLTVTLSDGRILEDVNILGADPRSDVAIVRIAEPPGDLPVATFGDSDALEVGEWVIAIGAPFELESSVSAGVVSAKGRTGVLPGARLSNLYSEEFIQTDAALNPGNSGGPLINLDGQVVGINTAIETGGQIRANVGVGFAIPINLARTIATSLIEHGIAQRGWLGVRLTLVGPSGEDTPAGMRLDHVVPGSPADNAGLRVGDIVESVDGRPLRDGRTLVARLTQAGPGGALKLRVHRDGRTRTVDVTVGEEPLNTYGLEVQSLDAATAKRLGLREDTPGAVITRVDEDSPAAADERNRLYPGDVILRINTHRGSFRITSADDFRKVMNLFQVQRPPAIEFHVVTKDGIFRVGFRTPEEQ